MNKKIFFLFALLFVMQKSFGQKFQGSIIGGFSTSQVSGDQLEGFDKSGFIAGGAVTLPLSEKFNMGMEIIFIQKGSKKKIDTENGDYSYYKMHLNYAEVPIVFEYKFSKRFRFHAAPSFGVLLSSKEEGDKIGNETLPFEKYEIGIGGGMSFFFSESFSIKLRISQSVLPIRKVGVDTQYVVSGQYNSVLAFMMQYHFKTKKKEISE